MTSAADLDKLMHLGWKARSEVAVDGWTVRLSAGVTQRANSVLPVLAPPDLRNAVVRVERLYLDHGLMPTFQISPAAQPVDLDEILARRGYELRGLTIVQVATVEDALRHLPTSGFDVQVRDDPDEDWLDLWWAVDGRGGTEARTVARHILTTGSALYASSRDGAGVSAVARLALVGRWAGVYCMAVRPDVRRRGHAMAVLRALLERAVDHGVRRVWLQVIADNDAARSLYERVGFVECSSYHYRILRT